MARFSVISASLLALTMVHTVLPSTLVAHGEENHLRDLTAAYTAAWATRDVEQILALHADDTEFRLFVDGTPTAIGKDAIRPQFESVFRSNPSWTTTAQDIQFGADFVYIRYQIEMDPDAKVTLGSNTFPATGASYLVDAMDYIQFKNGLVTQKHTFIDTEAIRRQSADRE